MSLRRKCRIKNIKFGPMPNRTRIYGKVHYRKLRAKYDPDHKVTPSWSELKTYGPIDQLWFLQSSTWIEFQFKSGAWVQLKFHAGFIWDSASDPLFKEWILEVFLAMFHDAAGSLHLLFQEDENKGFRAANRIFFNGLYWMIDNNDFDYSWFKRSMLKRKARIHYAFVSGIYARSLYAYDSILRAPNHSKTVQFTCSRNSEWGRKNG